MPVPDPSPSALPKEPTMTDDVMSDQAPVTDEAAGSASTRTEAQVRQAVRDIIVELSPERVSPDDDGTTLIDGLGYTSLALVELAFTLEDEFDLAPIDEVTARRLGTLRAVQNHVVAEL